MKELSSAEFGQSTLGTEQTPRCSVIMPVYNTPAVYLREAMESVLHQVFQDFELLIVDDGSEPYVQAVVESYGDARIRYFRQEKQSGAAAARNRALDVARGEFVAFMDADDISLPERLAKQVAYLDAHPEVGCLGTAYKIISGKKFKRQSDVPHDHEGIVSYLFFCGSAFCQSSVMLRRAMLEDPTPLLYRTELTAAHDCVLWFDLIGRTRFAILSDILVHYRVHPQSISGRMHAQQVRKMAEAQAALLARCSGSPFESTETWVRLLTGDTLSRHEYAEVSLLLQRVATALQAQYGFGSEAVLGALRQRLRKTFLRTHSLRGQWELLRLPLRRYAGLPLWWCWFTFITRGFF